VQTATCGGCLINLRASSAAAALGAPDKFMIQNSHSAQLSVPKMAFLVASLGSENPFPDTLSMTKRKWSRKHVAMYLLLGAKVAPVPATAATRDGSSVKGL